MSARGGATIVLALAISLGACKRHEPPVLEIEDAGPREDALPFVATPLAEITSSAAPAGKRVSVDVLILPSSIIQTSGTSESEANYMAAIDANAAYVKDAAACVADAKKLAEDAAKKLKRGRPPPPDFDKFLERYDALAKRISDLKPDPKASIAVKLDGFKEIGIKMEWSTVVDECTGPGCLNKIPTIPNLDIAGLNSCAMALTPFAQDECLALAEVKLDKMRSVNPPDLKDKLPELPRMNGVIDDPKVVARFNAIIPKYNAEVRRRQGALLDLMPGKIARLGRAAVASQGVKWTVQGVVEDIGSLASTTFEKIYGTSPARTVREVGSGAFARSYYKATRYCVTTTPEGLDLAINGSAPVKTPGCIDGVEGPALSVHIEGKGVAPLSYDGKVEIGVSNVTELECFLGKTEGKCESAN